MKFKSEEVQKGLDLIHPTLKSLCFIADEFCKRLGHEITLTETMSDPEKDKKLGRVSSSHSEGRAVDIRTNDLPKEVVTKLCEFLNTKYKDMGAISIKSKRRITAVFHDNGNGPHIHMQLGKDYIDSISNKVKWTYPKHEVKNGRSSKSPK